MGLVTSHVWKAMLWGHLGSNRNTNELAIWGLLWGVCMLRKLVKPKNCWGCQEMATRHILQRLEKAKPQGHISYGVQ